MIAVTLGEDVIDIMAVFVSAVAVKAVVFYAGNAVVDDDIIIVTVVVVDVVASVCCGISFAPRSLPSRKGL